ncbi:hypothetical protein JCM18899A_01110 [Nocardioides sp. AN3]
MLVESLGTLLSLSAHHPRDTVVLAEAMVELEARCATGEVRGTPPGTPGPHGRDLEDRRDHP